MSQRCKYFDQGCCHFGDDCRNLHIDGGHPGSGGGRRSRRCKFFDRGYCAYGDSCRFAHVGSGDGEGAADHGGADSDDDVCYASMPAEEEDDLVAQFGATSIACALPDQLWTLANRVYARLGADQKECRYRSELAREIRNLGYEVEEEMYLKCAKVLTGNKRYVDIYVNYGMGKDSAIIELKAVKKLTASHHAQLERYLSIEERSGHPVQYGFLINFPKNGDDQEVEFSQV